MAVANVCYHMSIPVANEKTWLHLLPLLPRISSPAKNIKNLGEIGWVARVFISMTLLPAMNVSGTVGHGWSQMNSANLYGGGDGGVCVCARVCARAWAWVRA